MVHQIAAFAAPMQQHFLRDAEFFSVSSPKFNAADNVTSVGFANDAVYGRQQQLTASDFDKLYFYGENYQIQNLA